jgi:hypothetical protein
MRTLGFRGQGGRQFNVKVRKLGATFSLSGPGADILPAKNIKTRETTDENLDGSRADNSATPKRQELSEGLALGPSQSRLFARFAAETDVCLEDDSSLN